jgi:hypothetical protein
MKDGHNKEILIVGIFIIFIGAVIVPSISGDIEKTNIKSILEKPIEYPLSDDYMLAHWKFDEGSGSTLEDSSSNNFDGAINGASWTTGYSGYALDFDGVNDYVNLDSYSQQLGINKTDDLIFSFYFKSTSTDSGLIYCLGGLYSVPEVRIELLSNGSLFFKAWTNACGIQVTSSEGFNNGSWHEAEIYFNGLSSNPTVNMYINGNPEGSVTNYLCEIENVDFIRAKMGRRAYSSTDFYDGLIDEFKIIKYEEGNEQESPEIDGPTGGEPGVEYDFTFVTNDPEEDDIQLLIDWDDGTFDDYDDWYESGEEAIISHEWEENGRYNITARSRDIWHHSSWSEPYPVFIGNQPPYPPTIGGPECGDSGVVYEYTFVAEDPEGNDVQYFIDWDDGDTWWTSYYASGEMVTVSHSWDSNGIYGIKSRAKDDRGNEGELSEPYLVRIGNEAPNAPSISGQKSGKAGVEYEYTFQTTDPESDDVFYEIQWGDGTSNTDEGPFASGEEAKISHTWDETGTYTIKARARDDPCGEYGEYSEYSITMPKSKPINFKYNLINWFFERYPNTIPIISYLFNQILN